MHYCRGRTGDAVSGSKAADSLFMAATETDMMRSFFENGEFPCLLFSGWQAGKHGDGSPS
jgi:hypothetical protein